MSALERSNDGSADTRFTLRRFALYAPLVVVLAAALWLTPRWLNPNYVNTDVSWLLILGERLLHGATPYVDFIETNPPLSILIYMPAILLAHGINAPPEYVLLAMILFGTCASVLASGNILRHSGLLAPHEMPLVAAFVLALLLILPGGSFAEREHIALITILPMLAVYAARANGEKVNAMAAFFCGIGGGITVSIKPHFALAILFPLALALWRSRVSPRMLVRLVLAPENVAVLLAGAFYLTSVFIYFPAFIHNTLPFDLTLYVPSVFFNKHIVTSPVTISLLATSIPVCVLCIKETRNPVITTSALAALGFGLAYFLQGKAYIYQTYPAVALFILAGGMAALRLYPKMMSSAIGPALPVRLGLAAAIALLLAGMFWMQWSWYNARVDLSMVTAAIKNTPYKHPRIFAFASGLATGLLPARELNGSWVGSTCCDWLMTIDARLANKTLDPKLRVQLRSYQQQVVTLTLRDINHGRPDIILMDGKSGHRSAFSHPEIATALQHYHKVAIVDGMEIWSRRDKTTNLGSNMLANQWPPPKFSVMPTRLYHGTSHDRP